MRPSRRPPLVLRLLSLLHAGLGGRPAGRRLLRRLRTRRLSRAWLRRAVVDRARDAPDDVTVVIGVRDRADHRIVNALKSLRAQTLPADAVRPVVVDYGSRPDAKRRIAEICGRYGAEHVRVEEAEVWSRGRCLNVGIRRAGTTFLVTSDADVVFSPGYLADAVAALRRSPLSVVLSTMLDLPPSATGAAEAAARSGEPLPLEAWRERCTPRLGWDCHPSIAVTHTAYVRLVRGYDEFYEVWGDEDRDLLVRLRRLGLTPLPLDTGAFYLHQWHPKFEGVPGGEDGAPIERNREHLERSHSILRNGPDWGVPPGAGSR